MTPNSSKFESNEGIKNGKGEWSVHSSPFSASMLDFKHYLSF